MTDKKFFLILVLALIFCGGLYYWGVTHSPNSNNVTNEDIEQKIEILEKKIDSLSFVRDSIRSVIDTSKVEIIKIHEEYNKVRTNVIYQPVDSDYSQFSKYCADNERLLDPNYTSTTEDNKSYLQRK